MHKNRPMTHLTAKLSTDWRQHFQTCSGDHHHKKLPLSDKGLLPHMFTGKQFPRNPANRGGMSPGSNARACPGLIFKSSPELILQARAEARLPIWAKFQPKVGGLIEFIKAQSRLDVKFQKARAQLPRRELGLGSKKSARSTSTRKRVVKSSHVFNKCPPPPSSKTP